MISLNLNTNIDVLPDDIEKEILNLIEKRAPTCYKKMSDKEIEFLKENIINNSDYKKYNISIEQIKSIRSSYVKNKMIKRHHYLISNSKKIVKDYKDKKDILYLSKKYDGSPLNILRVILKENNSDDKIKKLFNKPKLLNDYDLKQFEIAKKNDDFALVNQDEIKARADYFELEIGKVLEKMKVEFSTQNELVEEQMKTHGKPFSTPDFLIKSKLIINGHEINWIDAKNFYGSNISFVKKKITEQTQKYIKNYGKGAIIFNLGFNNSYLDTNILFLSWGSFINQ